MIEAMKFCAEVMFWGLIDLVLATVWAFLIAGLIWKILGKKND